MTWRTAFKFHTSDTLHFTICNFFILGLRICFSALLYVSVCGFTLNVCLLSCSQLGLTLPLVCLTNVVYRCLFFLLPCPFPSISICFFLSISILTLLPPLVCLEKEVKFQCAFNGEHLFSAAVHHYMAHLLIIPCMSCLSSSPSTACTGRHLRTCDRENLVQVFAPLSVFCVHFILQWFQKQATETLLI